MPEDDTIDRIIQRDLDRLPMLPADRWVPRTQPPLNWMHRAAFVPLSALIILVAVGAGLGLADWRAHRTATDEQQAAGQGVPGPLALAGGAPSLGFGLVSSSANTLLVRNETTPDAPFVYTSVLPQVAVSPNGHEIAFWRTATDASGMTSYQLDLKDILVSGGSNGATGPVPTGRLLTVPDGDVPGPIVWSSDGTGLIANTHTPATRGGDATASRPHASWFKVDVASTKVEQLPQAFDSFSVIYAWDRSRDLITGSTTSFGSPSLAGGPTFLTAKAGVFESHPVPNGGAISAADLYAKSVVIAYAGGCKGPPADSTLRCPVLEIRDQATFAIITGSAPVEATSGFPDVVFRPRSQDLIVQLPLRNGDARVELWSDLGRGTHQVLATYTEGPPFTARRELILPRVDGSAVFLLKFDGSAGGRWFGEVVALGSSNEKRLDPKRTTFEILSGGNPLASVVLDPAFARAMAPATQSAPSPRPAIAVTTPTGVNALPTTPQPSPSGPLTACGLVTGYASDGARMLLTLSTSDGTLQFNLEYQFASSPPPNDIGTRFAAKMPELIRVVGEQVPPDTGSPNAIRLKDFTVTRVDSCGP
jgi:hypothetical protein